MTVPIAEHALDRSRISANAIAVVAGLRDAGFEAYLVGGCIRDVLIGRTPKDFDVATSATPEDVLGVFPRSRSIGRRFRIVHVRMRREVVEVSTYRRALSDDAAQTAAPAHGAHDGGDRGAHSLLSSNGMILRDNAYGTIDEDAFRRDFTVNALYYDPIDDVLLDYCGGLQDIRARTLRLIGEPDVRFREDPVRILRAIRFAAKLGFGIDPATERAIAPARAMLAAVPPARLFDEFTKLFLSGHGLRAFELLQHYRLTSFLLQPRRRSEDLIRRALANTDARLREDKPVTPGFLLAAFLWHEYLHRSGHAPDAALPAGRGSAGRKPAGSEEELDAAAASVISTQSRLSIPRRHGYFMRDVWRLQPSLHQRTAQSVAKALEHRRFRAAYDFLMLRAEVDDGLEELGRWWTDAQTPEGAALRAELPSDRPRRRRRRRRGAVRAARSELGAAAVSMQ